MSLEQHVEALRASAHDDVADRALETRLRLRRSLETWHRVRRRVGIVAALGILFVGTASWAIATGKLVPKEEPAKTRIEIPIQSEHEQEHEHARRVVRSVEAPPPPVEVRVALPVETLYRRAHELHFHAADPGAALAAWDAYLAAEPSGRFAVEARYNRALCLIRLGRLGEAKQALLPFAHGEVEPSGYRQDEATALIERIGLNE